MKKLISILLACCLLCAVLPVFASAETLTGVCGDDLNYTLDLDAKTLTISGTGPMDDFGQNGEPMERPYGDNAWFYYADRIETIVLGEGATTIGVQAFLNFTALKRVELPQSLTKIETGAFSGCENLRELTLPENLQQADDAAFMNCKSLETLNIPAALTSLAPTALQGCSGLLAFEADAENPAFAGQDGVLLSRDGSVLVRYPAAKAADLYEVPETVREIAENAFFEAKIKQIVLPEGLAALGKGAFGKSELTEFTLPDAITVVPDALCGGCAALEQVTLHANVTEIGTAAFSACTALEQIALPDNLQRIGSYAFRDCAALQQLELPESLSVLESGAFSGTAISAITIPASVTVLDNNLFSGCANLSEVTLHNGIVSLGSGLFRGCTALEQISLPESVTEIKAHCFEGSGLKTFTFPQGVAQAELSVLENCTALQNADCSAVARIGMNAFRGCSALQSVTFGSPLVEIVDGAFDGCENLRDVYYSEDLAHWRSVSVNEAGNDPILTALVHATDGMTTLFRDVDPKAYYAEPVSWAIETGVTKGTDPGMFSPASKCTRAQIVTFLYRAAGMPAASGDAENPFADVKESAYYYSAVLWAVEKGVTKGTDDTHFSPDGICNRAQIVTFLWRASGSPEASEKTAAFTDVSQNAFYYDAVLWAVENGITKGVTETTFAPFDSCTRAQAVTFLYRAMAE